MTRRRVRTRAPAGAATTNGAAISRNRPLTPRPRGSNSRANNITRATERSLTLTTSETVPTPPPLGDDGYDITDYYAVDPRFGTLGDFVEMMRTADNLGIRVLVDLVMSHTSNQHPWFQRSRSDRDSRHRHYYRWSDTKQAEPSEVAFPGEQTGTWKYDEAARQWCMHRYYDFMPDLNITDPDVLDEMHKVLGFWLELGISGFRVDSLPFMIETIGTDAKDQPITYLRSLVEFLERPPQPGAPTPSRPSSPTSAATTTS